MPVAPWICIAWSMIRQTFSGTIAFTMLTQTRASRLPSTSIALAAFSTISRIASISMRARDTSSRQAFGKQLIQLGKNLELVSRARIEIEILAQLNELLAERLSRGAALHHQVERL